MWNPASNGKVGELYNEIWGNLAGAYRGGSTNFISQKICGGFWGRKAGRKQQETVGSSDEFYYRRKW